MSIEKVHIEAKEQIGVIEENNYLHQQVFSGKRGPHNIIGESPVMKKILADAHQVAKSHASVFITGESGTGKEVIAHAIHYSSPRAHCPFIRVNCAAIPEALIESEFFGHEKGAFTGANARRLGRFELAHGGSLLLDEVTEIPLSLQAKLLRVLQEQEFERVGGTRPVKVDVRVISTSNRDIKEVVSSKLLREDLYYRLNVVPIYIPPLRERPEDIIPLANCFLKQMCQENNSRQKELSKETEKKLLAYSWPGNVRELANILERAVVMDSSNETDVLDLHLDNIDSPLGQFQGLPVGITLHELEKRMIFETLQHQKNDSIKAAQMLGISVRKLKSLLQNHQQ